MDTSGDDSGALPDIAIPSRRALGDEEDEKQEDREQLFTNQLMEDSTGEDGRFMSSSAPSAFAQGIPADDGHQDVPTMRDRVVPLPFFDLSIDLCDLDQE